ncbi:protein rolling stone-like [Neocloeon triangulifer]|uniref:protein rolling stone-like n=1 Tax=Neocloeon triangulifer TaxID=2078957 RepID=UPI00286F8885|nr:protein rolling stone-like [Neocloeon triangulifer]XP_059475010.1 protein rolling stone-like [Neocloeon triangulifer]
MMFPSVGFTFKREFSAHYRSLQHDRPQDFVTSQWQGKGSKHCICTYLLYKCFIAVYLVSMLVLDLMDLGSIGSADRTARIAKWPVHLTSWNSAVLTLQAVLSAILVSKFHLSLTNFASCSEMTRLHKTYWVVHNIANALSPAVSLLYWAAVYKSDMHQINLFNIHKHLLNTIIIVVDLLVNSHPIRILHVYQPVILGASYGAFAWIYYLCGGTNRENQTKIYPVLDWETPHVGILASAGACALLVVIHTLLWVIHLARVRLAKLIFSTQTDLQMTETPQTA